MKKIVLVAAFMLAGHFGFAQDAAYKADAEKYLEVSGQMKTFDYLTEEIMQNIPEGKRAEFKKEFEVSLKDFKTKMAEIYMQEFTHGEIKELIKLYETPIGKKLYEKNKVLYDKGQIVGTEWGMGLQGMMMKYMEM
ncbi:DUF2059 domain-containing protein [Myroides sp. 1354]|uniref:DUF2059 domain-containing protein n=1 Tax=unclassified Myroides TaxID=2642485 RepID=UPI002578C416|nr:MULTISPECIES: DUF2059 domain-containing protein [unclassified Myroides]MDM1046391.1 DUF2059 domain-containing protein [Myroides sp. R163-1]MDM1057328.1 DUF2059 domain-containing protein [Myroides sp. 1354]MDM1070576.1 DUF2059 domain-containing protein [Myroides sp. 1372]